MSKTRPGQNPVYMGPKQGPFKCANCEYYIGNKECVKKEMISFQQKSPARVDPEGCCNYFEKNDNLDEDEDPDIELDEPSAS